MYTVDAGLSIRVSFVVTINRGRIWHLVCHWFGRVVQVIQNVIRAFVGLICFQIWLVKWYSYQYLTNSFSPFSYWSSHCAKLHTLHAYYALSSFYLHNLLSCSVLLDIYVFANLKLTSINFDSRNCSHWNYSYNFDTKRI